MNKAGAKFIKLSHLALMAPDRGSPALRDLFCLYLTVDFLKAVQYVHSFPDLPIYPD